MLRTRWWSARVVQANRYPQLNAETTISSYTRPPRRGGNCVIPTYAVCTSRGGGGGGEYISAQFAALLQLRHRCRCCCCCCSVGMQQQQPASEQREARITSTTPKGYFWAAPRVRMWASRTLLTLNRFLTMRLDSCPFFFIFFFPFLFLYPGLITTYLECTRIFSKVK